MMSMILFAMIGAGINVGPAYWVIYGIYCAWKIIKFLSEPYRKE